MLNLYNVTVKYISIKLEKMTSKIKRHLMYSLFHNYPLYLLSKHFPHTQRPSSHSPFPPVSSPWQTQSCFLSLWVCLLWIFHINGIVQYMTFCVWLLSFSIMFSWLIHIVALSVFHPIFGWIIFQCMDIPHFYSFIVNGHLGCFHLFAIVNSAAVHVHLHMLID